MWLSVWIEVQSVACGPADGCIPKLYHLLPHLNADWCRLTQVVLEKKTLNGCSGSVVVVSCQCFLRIVL